MDFKQIEAFVNVAKYRSFSKAADAIYLSQPTISAHIASLEQELNIVLFDRHGKEVPLTNAGSLFLEYAINLINIRNTAITSISDFDNTIAGTLYIASSTTPCRFMLPSLVKSFYDLYPDVIFSIKESSTKGVIEDILSGESDIGIVGEIIEDARLSYHRITRDKLVLISNNPNLPEKISMSRLFQEKFISREKGSATRNVFENVLRNMGYSPEKLDIISEVSSLEAVLQFVKNGVGISVVSELACADYISTGLIKKHEVENLNISRDIYLVTHIKRTLPPVAREFQRHIEDVEI